MKATYLEHSGSDLSVVNAARVSFGKRKEVFDEKDERLLRYLAKHGHEFPFAHPHISFHFEAPVFVARQLAKSQVGFVWSEISGRYVELDQFYDPGLEWREQAPDKKQGSKDERIDNAFEENAIFEQAARDTAHAYNALLDLGVCKEQARIVLPLATRTEWHWTGSLLGWARVWRLRTAPDAQRETRELVKQIDGPLSERFPVAWKVLKERVES